MLSSMRNPFCNSRLSDEHDPNETKLFSVPELASLAVKPAEGSLEKWLNTLRGDGRKCRDSNLGGQKSDVSGKSRIGWKLGRLGSPKALAMM